VTECQIHIIQPEDAVGVNEKGIIQAFGFIFEFIGRIIGYALITCRIQGGFFGFF
jgi:hypothetical protein